MVEDKSVFVCAVFKLAVLAFPPVLKHWFLSIRNCFKTILSLLFSFWNAYIRVSKLR